MSGGVSGAGRESWGAPSSEEGSRLEADDASGGAKKKEKRGGKCAARALARIKNRIATHRNVAPGTVNDVTLKKASESLRLMLHDETETGPLHGSLISRWSSPELSFRCCSTLWTSCR